MHQKLKNNADISTVAYSISISPFMAEDQSVPRTSTERVNVYPSSGSFWSNDNPSVWRPNLISLINYQKI
jgi:hypothetical protein